MFFGMSLLLMDFHSCGGVGVMPHSPFVTYLVAAMLILVAFLGE